MNPAYPVVCQTSGCGRPAVLKVAAGWSDGQTRELKTYALSCEGCVEPLFAAAVARHAACRPAAGEVLDPPAVYEWSPGRRDRDLVRRPDPQPGRPAE